MLPTTIFDVSNIVSCHVNDVVHCEVEGLLNITNNQLVAKQHQASLSLKLSKNNFVEENR